MCEYCNNNEREYIEDYINENSQHIKIYIENKELCFETGCFIESIKINYCPMCGRKFNRITVNMNIANKAEQPTFTPLTPDETQTQIKKTIEKSIFDVSNLGNNFMQGGMT